MTKLGRYICVKNPEGNAVFKKGDTLVVDGVDGDMLNISNCNRLKPGIMRRSWLRYFKSLSFKSYIKKL